MKITSASLTDREDLKQLWKTAFGDSDEYINNFFNELFAPSFCIIAKEGSELAGMLFLLPAELQTDGKKLSCGYVCGAATAIAFRNQGVMRKCENACGLLAQSLKLDMLSLVPQEPSLFEMYSRMGYSIASYREETTLAPAVSNGRLSVCSQNDFLSMRDAFLNTKPAFIELDRTVKVFRFTSDLASKPLIYSDGECMGYVVGEHIGSDYIIIETSLPLKYAARAAYTIQRTLPGVKRIKVYGLGGKQRPYGMIKPLSDFVTPKLFIQNSIYMSMMLD